MRRRIATVLGALASDDCLEELAESNPEKFQSQSALLPEIIAALRNSALHDKNATVRWRATIELQNNRQFGAVPFAEAFLTRAIIREDKGRLVSRIGSFQGNPYRLVADALTVASPDEKERLVTLMRDKELDIARL